jgi:hypothetical protein
MARPGQYYRIYFFDSAVPVTGLTKPNVPAAHNHFAATRQLLSRSESVFLGADSGGKAFYGSTA